MALCMIGIEEADETVYKWVINPDNKIVRLSGLLSRLYDDTQTDEEEAIEGYKGLIDAAWKDINEAWMRPWPVPKIFFSLAFYLASFNALLYEHDDGYSRPENTTKHLIIQAFIDPIPL
ncbi:Terpenoid synthase [Corchorus olitorius]|uniref:Terpenoid synthase n=1 Tax=Corchorus olitorius TaxID=93759 RepID=A0A1R3IZI7_9ROSI|nr:Terpenoid synthase [Corchorus olitorius]